MAGSMYREPKKFKFVEGKKQGADGIVSVTTNGQRAEYANLALAKFLEVTGDANDGADTVVDLIADLGHLCDKNGQDFKALVIKALQNWKFER